MTRPERTAPQSACAEKSTGRMRPRWSGLSRRNDQARAFMRRPVLCVLHRAANVNTSLFIGRNHSADEPWEQPDPSLSWVDRCRIELNRISTQTLLLYRKHSFLLTQTLSSPRYLRVVLYAALVPKVLLLALPLLFTVLPITMPMSIFGAFLPAVADRPARGCGFVLIFYVFMPILMLPFGLLAATSLLYDYAFYYLFGIPLWFARGSPSRAGSLAVLAPFRTGPFVWTHCVDFLVCVLGQCMRNGMGATDSCAHRLLSFFEVATQLTYTVLAVPLIKYWINSNPWAFDLRQRYVQQISTTGKDMPPQVLSMTLRRLISRCKQRRSLTGLLDNWAFLPHYPYPPSSRRYALGMQQYKQKFFLLVHLTHATSEARGVREQLLLSGSAPMPVYRVML